MSEFGAVMHHRVRTNLSLAFLRPRIFASALCLAFLRMPKKNCIAFLQKIVSAFIRNANIRLRKSLSADLVHRYSSLVLCPNFWVPIFSAYFIVSKFLSPHIVSISSSISFC